MIIFVGTHWVAVGDREAGEAYVDDRSAEMATWPGFRMRYRLNSSDDPLKITTITVWDSREQLEAYTDWYKSSPGWRQFPYTAHEREVYDVDVETMPQTT